MRIPPLVELTFYKHQKFLFLNPTTLQALTGKGYKEISSSTNNKSVEDGKALEALLHKQCRVVEDRKGGMGKVSVFL